MLSAPEEKVAKMLHLSPYVSGILLVYAMCALGLLSPGPGVLSVIGTSMGSGRKAGIYFALGVSAGTPIWAVATSVGLSALLAVYAGALIGIKIVGGLYLLWLACKAFHRSAASSKKIQALVSTSDDHPWRHFMRGLTVQITNPKSVLTWIAIMSLGVQKDAPYWVVMAIVLGGTTLSIVGHLLYALTFSTGRMVSAYRRSRRWIEFGPGSFFGIAGVRLLASR
jgi:amino acid exporter